jgi:molecular chaperone HscB
VERASSSNDAFGLLGLPAQFDLDPQLIERAFFDRSKELHPDRFANAPAAERVAALSRSRALNDAYQRLKKPVPRAEYLLARAGVTIGDNEQLDPEFLMEILELREELAEARVGRRTSESASPGSAGARSAADAARSTIEKLCAAMKQRRQAAIDSLTPLFAQNDLAGIKTQLILLRYIDRYLEECDAALDED